MLAEARCSLTHPEERERGWQRATNEGDAMTKMETNSCDKGPSLDCPKVRSRKSAVHQRVTCHRRKAAIQPVPFVAVISRRVRASLARAFLAIDGSVMNRERPLALPGVFKSGKTLAALFWWL